LPLAKLAGQDRAARFARRPLLERVCSRILCVALCQGAALHYVDGKNGVKDIDVWTFYPEHSEGKIRPTGCGPTSASRASGAGRNDPHAAALKGRRVDLIGRSLDDAPGADPVAALTH
jgi:hypothetical protein